MEPKGASNVPDATIPRETFQPLDFGRENDGLAAALKGAVVTLKEISLSELHKKRLIERGKKAFEWFNACAKAVLQGSEYDGADSGMNIPSTPQDEPPRHEVSSMDLKAPGPSLTGKGEELATPLGDLEGDPMLAPSLDALEYGSRWGAPNVSDTAARHDTYQSLGSEPTNDQLAEAVNSAAGTSEELLSALHKIDRGNVLFWVI